MIVAHKIALDPNNVQAGRVWRYSRATLWTIFVFFQTMRHRDYFITVAIELRRVYFGIHRRASAWGVGALCMGCYVDLNEASEGLRQWLAEPESIFRIACDNGISPLMQCHLSIFLGPDCLPAEPDMVFNLP